MLQTYATLPLVSRALVALGWVGFFIFFAFKRQPGAQTVAKRDPVSLAGIGLQLVAFALVWMFQRPLPRAGTPLGVREVILDLVAPALSIASTWIGLAAVRTLGEQWSLAARLIEGHQLVVRGPYRLVRHPIYTGMLGKLLAANFAFGHWLGLVSAGSVFLVGTMIRIHSEEKLLRGQFGADYDAYARVVPALLPWVH